MSDYHKGDVVYVPEVGSVTEVGRLVINQSMDGVIRCIGYDTEFGMLQSTQMHLVKGGYDRGLVEDYLKERGNG